MTNLQRLGYFLLGLVLAALLVVGTAWDWLQQPLPAQDRALQVVNTGVVSVVRSDLVCRGDCEPDRASTPRTRCLGCL